MTFFQKLSKKQLFTLLSSLLVMGLLLITGVSGFASDTLSYFYVGMNPAGQIAVLDSPDDLGSNQTLEILAKKAHIDDLIDRHEALVDRVDGLDSELNESIEALEDEFSDYQDVMDIALEELRDDLVLVEEDIEDLEETLSNLDAVLDDRVTALEEDVSDIEGAIDELDNRVTTLENDISSLEVNLEALDDRVTALEEAFDDIDLAEINERINDLETENEALKAQIEEIEGLLDIVFTPPVAEITSPEEGAVLSGIVTFEGIAYSEHIDYWSMQWSGPSIVSITNGSDNVGDTENPGVFRANYDIDYWVDLGWLEPGDWTIQLLVYDQLGRRVLYETDVTIEASGD